MRGRQQGDKGEPVAQLDDTIVAISTPIGESGIGIVRMSGARALEFADAIFQGARQQKPSQVPTYTTHYGKIVSQGEVIDEVILTVMRAPKTYTREDVAEINCHGGIVPLRQVLELVLSLGARMAEPGEFTKRAFLNGRIDLAQAEAVLDVIRARTDASLQVAMRQLNGHLSRKVKELRDQLIDLIVHLEAEIDFPDEGLDTLTPSQVSTRTRNIASGVRGLLESADQGKVWREGILTAIIGRPNVGKSSLMNVLLGEDRVIVTPVPGTTRDVIEEVINLQGIPLRVVDTAGIRETESVVEIQGVERSRFHLEQADLVLLVFDGSEPLTNEDRQLIDQVAGRSTIAVINKTDLPQQIEVELIEQRFPADRIVRTSATQGTGLSQLQSAIADLVWQGQARSPESALVANARHKDALARADGSLARALEAIGQGRSAVRPVWEELLLIDLQTALDCLGEIVGETVTEEILDRIFSQFCIGK